MTLRSVSFSMTYSNLLSASVTASARSSVRYLPCFTLRLERIGLVVLAELLHQLRPESRVGVTSLDHGQVSELALGPLCLQLVEIPLVVVVPFLRGLLFGLC